MTLIVGITCTDGVVIAADSASTDMEARTKQPSIKVHQLCEMPCYIGGTGDVGLMQKVLDALESNRPSIVAKGSLNSLRKEIKKYHHIEATEARQYFVSIMNGDRPPVLGLLLVGIMQRTPYVLEINPNNTDTEYKKDMGGFYAVGSGASLAHSLYRPYLFETENRTMEAAKVQAYRVIDDSIDIAHFGLSHPIHVYSISLDGKTHEANLTELESIRDTCELWRDLERGWLNQALSGDRAERAGIPTPAN